MEFGIDYYSNMVPGGLQAGLRASQAAPREFPGSAKASPGSPCDSCLAPPGPPCESLAAPWHCLGASKSYFGSLGAPNVWF